MSNSKVLQELLADHQHYHSTFQIDHFITETGCGRHVYGMYKQALRELHARWKTITEEISDLELLQIDLDETEAKLSGMGERSDPFEKRRLEVERRRLEWRLPERQRALQDLVREFSRFYAQALALRTSLGTHPDFEALDREMWVHRIKCAMATDFLFRGSPSPETLGRLHSLPKKLRNELQSLPAQGLIAWYRDLDIDGAKENPIATLDAPTYPQTLEMIKDAHPSKLPRLAE